MDHFTDKDLVLALVGGGDQRRAKGVEIELQGNRGPILTMQKDRVCFYNTLMYFKEYVCPLNLTTSIWLSQSIVLAASSLLINELKDTTFIL